MLAYLGGAADDVSVLLGVDHFRDAPNIIDEQRDAHHRGLRQHVGHVVNHGRQHQQDAICADGCQRLVPVQGAARSGFCHASQSSLPQHEGLMTCTGTTSEKYHLIAVTAYMACPGKSQLCHAGNHFSDSFCPGEAGVLMS